MIILKENCWFYVDFKSILWEIWSRFVVESGLVLNGKKVVGKVKNIKKNMAA